MSRRTFPRAAGLVAASALAVLTGGCATLPQAGPTGGMVQKEAGPASFDLIEINRAEALPVPPPQPSYMPFPPKLQSGVERIAVGDVLNVVFYEVGVRIFSGAPGAPGGAFDPSAKAEAIGGLEVDQAGTIRLPYVGTMRAAGRTTRQLADEIEDRLRGKSEYPQVIVRLEAANGSGVMLAGEIARPGRMRLSAAHEKLLDAIALAGGPRDPRANLLVRVERDDQKIEIPLDDLAYANLGGMPLEPGDRIEIVRAQRSFAVLGSANRVNRYDLPLRRFPLVEALAVAGGPNENFADPAAVFVFRFERRGPEASTEAQRPVVYHFNMLKPASYLLAQQFYTQDNDVIYVAGAEANQPSKLLQVIGQVLGPAAVARQLTK